MLTCFILLNPDLLVEYIIHSVVMFAFSLLLPNASLEYQDKCGTKT